MTQQEALMLLSDDLHAALEQAGYKGKLSVSVDADIVLAGSEEKSGIVMSELAETFDRVYVKVTAEQIESVTEAMKTHDVELNHHCGERRRTAAVISSKVRKKNRPIGTVLFAAYIRAEDQRAMRRSTSALAWRG